MKICPKCKSTYSNEMKFCKKCGTPLSVMQGGMQGQNIQKKVSSSNKKKKPALIIAIIAALLIIVAAVVLVLFKFTDILGSGSNTNRVEKEDDRDKDDDKYNENDDDETEDTEDTEDTEKETELWETADINAVDEGIQTITGSFLKNGEGYELVFAEAVSVYVNDMEGESVMVESCDAVTVSVPDNTYKMYADHEVSVTGSMFLDGEDLIILLEEIEALDLDTNPLVEVSVGTHNYEIIMSNGTWQDAFNECIERGGYLARIDSAEEYDVIVSMLRNAGNPSETHYYLGGRRDADGTEYYWVDTDNEFTGELLNASDSWTNGYWFKGEPSFEDAGSGQYNGIDEAYLNLFCVNGVWYLNDGSGDFYGNYTSLLAGKIGYVMEYE